MKVEGFIIEQHREILISVEVSKKVSHNAGCIALRKWLAAKQFYVERRGSSL